ncbi:MAG: Crp/Fnr family transcriptional regulator [Bacteroidota bacterium]
MTNKFIPILMKLKFSTPYCETCISRISSFFALLNDEDLSKIVGNKTCGFYKKGQPIFGEGKKPLGIFCISKGKVKIHKLGDTGKDQIVRLAKLSNILGYRAFISGEYYTASATALEDSVICFIPKSTFSELLQSNPDLSMKLLQFLSNDLRTAETQITHLAQRHVRERLAETLLILKEYYGVENDGATLSVSMTREEIANMVGTATETVIRIFSEFKKEKLIGLNGRKLKILDHPALIKASNIWGQTR